MNTGQLTAAIDRRTGEYHSPDALLDFLNEALQQLSVAADWPWLQTMRETTATGADETLPTAARSILAVTVEGIPYPLLELTDGDDSNSCRIGYVVRGSTLVLLPTPAGTETLRVHYLANEAELVNDDDTPLLPAAHHRVLADFASSIVLERADPARASRYRALYDQWVANMKRTTLHPQRVGMPRVRPGGGV